MLTNSFEGPKLKIARGRFHAAALEAQIAEYLKKEPWALLSLRDKTTGETVIALKGRCEIPATLSLIFGDAVHNFRTALDIAANDAVASQGVTPKKVYFPFGQDAQGFETQLNEKMKQAPAVIQEIVRSFRPYQGGNELLRALHDLDIGDKHVAIITAAASGATPSLPFNKPTISYVPGAMRITATANFGALRTTPIDLTGFPSDANPNLETIGKIVGSEVKLVIAKGLPLESQPVMDVLKGMGDIAERLVLALENGCIK